MNNYKRMMLYAVMDAVLAYKRDGSEEKFLYTDELGRYLKKYEIDITDSDIKNLVDLTPVEIASKMELVRGGDRL